MHRLANDLVFGFTVNNWLTKLQFRRIFLGN